MKASQMRVHRGGRSMTGALLRQTQKLSIAAAPRASVCATRYAVRPGIGLRDGNGSVCSGRRASLAKLPTLGLNDCFLAAALLRFLIIDSGGESSTKFAACRRHQIPIATELVELMSIGVAGGRVLAEVVKRPTIVRSLDLAVWSAERADQPSIHSSACDGSRIAGHRRKEHQTVADAAAVVRAELIVLLAIFLEEVKGDTPSIGKVPAQRSSLSSDDDGRFGDRRDEECCYEDCNDTGDHLVGPAFAPRKRNASRAARFVLVAYPASTVIPIAANLSDHGYSAHARAVAERQPVVGFGGAVDRPHCRRSPPVPFLASNRTW
jgi:hypothetical protein